MTVNTILKQHNRVVYSNQAIHHVARQIESLYWDTIKKDAANPESNSSGIEIGADLSNHLWASYWKFAEAGDGSTLTLRLELLRDYLPNGKEKMSNPRKNEGNALSFNQSPLSGH